MFFIYILIISYCFSQNPIDFYLYGDNIHTIIGGFQNGIDKPRDLDFNPLHDNELWILNEGESPYANNTEYINYVCVPENSELMFTIYDSYSDGICCESGEGSYEVIGCDNTFVYGGDFESSESTIFTADVSCESECPNGNIELSIIISTDNWGKETSWELIDNISNHIYANRLAPGGSTVTFFEAGLDNQTSEYRKDSYSRHFMNTASALSFDDYGFFANTLECKDANNNPNGLFSGPTLWNSDFSVYAAVNQEGPLLGSHLDMIHQSPYSMGIEHAGQGNVYWVYDGYHSAVVRYDFATPHEYGGHDHSDGKVWRYGEINLQREPGVSSHMVLDDNSNTMYIADTGNNRILFFDVNSGVFDYELTPYGESLDQYWMMKDAEWNVFINDGLDKPSGIDVYDNRLIVSDYSSGDIIIYDISNYSPVELGRINTGHDNKIMGITIGPNQNIWYVNYTDNEVVRIDYNILFGDVNFDTVLDILDLVSIISFIVGDQDFNDNQIYFSDLNQDQIINILDVVALVSLILDN